jgi:hypothetical protein
VDGLPCSELCLCSLMAIIFLCFSCFFFISYKATSHIGLKAHTIPVLPHHCLFVFVGSTKFELRTLHLPGRHCTTSVSLRPFGV